MVSISDIRQELHLFVEAELSDDKIRFFINDVEDDVGATITDDRSKRYLTCYRIIMSLIWNGVERIGDTTFSTKNAQYFKDLYMSRVAAAGFRPEGLDFQPIQILKINADKMDSSEIEVP